jgi:hypothetical protein
MLLALVIIVVLVQAYVIPGVVPREVAVMQ